MKKLIFIFLLIISCSKKDPVAENETNVTSETNGTNDSSAFGKINSMPSQFFDKVNPDVGKWNLSANKQTNNDSKSGLKESTEEIYSAYSISFSRNSENEEYIEEQMSSISQQVNNLIDEELSILSAIETYLDGYIDEFNSDSFDYDSTNYNVIKDSLFVKAEELHNEALSKRNDAVAISAEALGEEAFEAANYYINLISTKINDAVPISIDRISQFFQLTHILYDEFNVDFNSDVIAEIEEFFNVPDKISPINQSLSDILFNGVYENLLGSEWINSYGEINSDFNFETYTTKINLFPSRLEEINGLLELFKGFYEQALELESQFENTLSELTYESSKNLAKMIINRNQAEIGGRYSEMNAWKLALLYEYIGNTKVEYLVNVGEFPQEYNEIFENQSGYERLPCVLYGIIVGLEPIEAEANQYYPDFDYLGISYENWPSYDEQFEYRYDFDAMRAGIQEELNIRINENGCGCFYEAGYPVDDFTMSFSVDMNSYEDSFEKVYMFGQFNDWCADCDEMTDANQDGIYEIDIDLVNCGGKTSLEYKFILDGNKEETFSVGDSCTKTTGQWTNRYVETDSNTNTTIETVCFNSCSSCE